MTSEAVCVRRTQNMRLCKKKFKTDGTDETIVYVKIARTRCVSKCHFMLKTNSYTAGSEVSFPDSC